MDTTLTPTTTTAYGGSTYEANAAGRLGEYHVLHELKHCLRSQQVLKDFLHYDSLHAFQHINFYDAIFKASEVFGCRVHLQLPEYRKLYDTGRIRGEVLKMVTAAAKEQNPYRYGNRN